MRASFKGRLTHADADLDLVPMIDCIFLLLLFFMLCGRISMEERPEQITVPPTKTATTHAKEWEKAVINVRGGEAGGVATTTITIGPHVFRSVGNGDHRAYAQLRAVLDRMYDRAPKYADAKVAGLRLPKVEIEVRADGDADYRVVQELEQVLADCVDAQTLLPRAGAVEQRRPFVHVGFSARLVDGG
ncbi:MAG: biopolymer transporter ExbD [Planctomycetes bacterium]|nr:biopolymer transporter ExbD [Planctomycetota bacterium]